MAKVGRPTKMTPEAIAKLEQAFASGATDLEACFYANIGKDVLYDYIKINPDFHDRKEGLKKQLNLIAKNQLAKSIKDGNIHDAKWHLERKAKDEYSTQVNNKNENEGTIEIIVSKKVHSARDND